jgi:hypothetical protein
MAAGWADIYIRRIRGVVLAFRCLITSYNKQIICLTLLKKQSLMALLVHPNVSSMLPIINHDFQPNSIK